MEFARIFNKPMQNLRFRERSLAKLFLKNNINVECHNMITNQALHQSLLRSLEIACYGEAKNLAFSLNKLGIKKICLEPSVIIGEKIIDKGTLMSALKKHIDQEFKLERIVIRTAGLRNCWIEGSELILAQRTFTQQELEKESERIRQSAVFEAVQRREINWVGSDGKEAQKNVPHEEVSPEDLVKYTIKRGEKGVAVSQVAEILILIAHPETGRPLLEPEIWQKMGGLKWLTLDSSILSALLEFKRTYMGISEPDDNLGPIEFKRLLTYHTGYMLTKIDNPETQKPYLDPIVFKVMTPPQKVRPEISEPNFVFIALKEFIRSNGREKALEITDDKNIFKDKRIYELLRDHFEKQVKT